MITILSVFPELLDLNGDAQNALVLAQRLRPLLLLPQLQLLLFLLLLPMPLLLLLPAEQIQLSCRAIPQCDIAPPHE